MAAVELLITALSEHLRCPTRQARVTNGMLPRQKAVTWDALGDEGPKGLPRPTGLPLARVDRS